MSQILFMESVSDDLVVVKVKPDLTPLDIALNPWVNKDIAYISVTRGKNHIMTFISPEGETWSIEWGDNGYTLISDALRERKNKIVEFIKDRGVSIGLRGPATEATILFNHNFNRWQLTLQDKTGNSDYLWFNEANDENDMFILAEKYVPLCEWNFKIAPTGIATWEASFICK